MSEKGKCVGCGEPLGEGTIVWTSIGEPTHLTCHPRAKALTVDHPVNHPRHYTSHPSGVECITITEHMNFCLGNALKYIWRAGSKGSETTVQDLEKAKWYISREIERLTKAPK